jgi:glutamine amidotransferase
MIIVIDYNVGNVKSVCNAFKYIGCDVGLSADSETIKKAGGLVLPGVAAFGYAINQLGSLADTVRGAAFEGRPLLGICVGFQMLFEQSSELGVHKGLGLIKGQVTKIPSGRVIPHMGWNLVELPEEIDIFDGLGGNRHFYFAHSYYAKVEDEKAEIAYSDYGFDMPAAVRKANIYGTQFHPEKSGPAGLKVLSNFARICRKVN